MRLRQFPDQLVLEGFIYAIPEFSPRLLYARQILRCRCTCRCGAELRSDGFGKGGVEFVEAVYGSGNAVEGYAF